ncbi:hypothetical protein P0O15_02380 [Methanotrichaceae archaeon Mx]|uniref:Lipid/polyisoprenoid-binding YceI-like domain-containing protein n=2 Tax=Candidatus Methanocrinis natronophilus TaxID=3033396 RepID=A0ABT5X5Q7_9EURY|nr:hypothetical protein [Candidatus Methanocrinis natronophilus]
MRGGGYLAALSAMAFLLVVSAATPSAAPTFLLSDLSKEAEYPPKAPVGPALAEAGLIFAGNGLASNSSADLPITLIVERGKVMRPSHARKLFDDLARIDVSGGRGSKMDAESGPRGRMLLSGRPYILGDIEISCGMEETSLRASVLKGTFSGEVEVGYLQIKAEMRGRVWDGRGTLKMADGIIRGGYAVVLEISPQADVVEERTQVPASPPPDLSMILEATSPPRRR